MEIIKGNHNLHLQHPKLVAEKINKFITKNLY